MADSKEKLNKAMINGKLSKYGVTKKTMFSLSSILACIFLIVVLAIVSAQFNPEKLKTLSYWIELLISIAICIFSMIAGKQMGDDITKNKPDGSYRLSLKRYGDTIKTIKDLKLYAYIEDWLEKYRAKKLQTKIEMYLLDNGIKQLEVLDLDFDELNQLLKGGYCKDWSTTMFRAKYFDDKTETSKTYFLGYTQEQIEIIKQCKEGKIKVSHLPVSFFVNAFNQSEKDMWESSAKAAEKKGLFLGNSYTYKIIAMVAISMLLSGLEPMLNEYETKSMLLTMFSRLFTLISSVVWGAYIGFQLVKIEQDYLDFKDTIMSLFIEEYKEGIYQPRTIQEEAKAAYEERKKNELNLATIPGEILQEV